MKSLADQTAIVTGAGSGIGRGIALALAKEGAGRREHKIEDTANAISETGVDVLAEQADVSQPDDVDRLVKSTLDKFGSADILINNAGIGGGGPIHAHDIATWNRVMDVNLSGAFLMTRAVLPYMRSQENGHIINISSESGLEHYVGNGAYGVSKHALNAFGEYTQRENQDLNIRVNTICPGMVVTEMTANAPGLDHDKCLCPEDIADLVIWLLTRRSNIKIGTPILIQTMQNPWK
jgi:3-oxoacyl-[acyl-carrier protein] reductase